MGTRTRSGGWRRALAAVLLALVATLAAPFARGEDDVAAAADPAEALAAAEGLLGEGRAAEAARLLERALEAAGKGLAPDAGLRLRAALGDALLRAGESYAALKPLQTVVDDRGEPGDHLRLAEALLAVARQNAAGPSPRWIEVAPYLEDARMAAEEAQRVAGADETPALAARRRSLLGEVRYRQGDPAAAVEAWKDLPFETLPPDEVRRIADLLARACYELGRFDEAAEAWARAEHPRGRASALAAARRGPEAVAVYAALLREDPADPVLLEEALAAARYAGAEAELAGALADLEVEGEAKARVLVTRGLLSESSGAVDAAQRLFRAAAEADPASPRPPYELGRLLLLGAEGRDAAMDEAIAALLDAFGKDPTDARLSALLWDLAGRDYASAWRSSAARERTIRIQRALVAADPNDGIAHANLGNTLRIAGEAEPAVEAYDAAIAAEPDDPQIASDRGLALSALGRLDDALEAFEGAARLDPDYDAAHQNAARILWLRGEDELAARHLAEAEARTRARGGNWMRYRFLLDRVHRSRVRPGVR